MPKYIANPKVSQSSPIIKIAFSGKIPVILSTEDISEAVQWAADHGTLGDVALLSPACASFDLFNNYEDRGNQFKEAVIRLKDKN